MTFKKQDFFGLAALLVGFSLGANLTATQKKQEIETAKNQIDLGEPFLQQLAPLELQAHTVIPRIEQPQTEGEGQTFLVQFRRLTKISKK